jgi:uncharacterized lipoprotein YddW (UPF0748 family)
MLILRSRVTVIALAVALVLPLVLSQGSSPAQAARGSGACASHLVPATPFTDTLTTPHRAAIDCAVWWDLAHGRTTTSFAPSVDITRGQAAAMVARLLRTTGHAPSTAPAARFTDTAGHTFERDIDLLVTLDIVQGITATTFEPNRPITRDQMASVISRTFTHGYDAPLASGSIPFTDVSGDNVHRDAIGRLVGAGIATGTTATTYSPRGFVLRAQMASFLTRSADVLRSDGLAERPSTRPAADDAYASRMRAAWVHLFDGTLKTRAGIRAMVDELATADANAVIAQVARRHDAYYPSDVLPRTPDPAVAADFDVLEELIAAAHAKGIEVHAWFGVGPTWHEAYRDLPAPDGWMHTTHGLGTEVERDRWVSRTYDGEWSSYLDPGVPAVRAHVAAVVRELAERYDVDGIHLDYVRYESARHGYNDHALTRFRRDTGFSGTPAPSDPQWTSWRRDQTRDVIDRSRQAIATAGRDDVTLSAAVITWADGPATPDRAGFRATLPYTRTLQDWDRWVRDGALDAVMPMNYFRAHEPEPAGWFASWLAYERALATAASTQVVPGPAGYLNHPANVRAQTRAAMRVDGATIYSFQQPTLDHSRELWGRLARTRWGYSSTR